MKIYEILIIIMAILIITFISIAVSKKAEAKQYNVTAYGKDAYIAGADCQHIYTYQNGKEYYVNTICVPKN